MSFLLDTNIVSAHLRRPRGLAHRFTQYSGRLYVSSVALAELYVWAHGKADPTSRLAAIEVMLRDEVRRLDFDDDCARKFGRKAAITRTKQTAVAKEEPKVKDKPKAEQPVAKADEPPQFTPYADLRIRDIMLTFRLCRNRRRLPGESDKYRKSR
jgi:predicted nucleic acid-binding protein